MARSGTTSWTTADIPDQSGRTVVITGGNSGLGAAAAGELAARGAHVVLACRTVAKGVAAAQRMAGDVEVRELDLADLASVRAFAAASAASGERIDVLINNAGVMAVPRARTVDGFELQLGTNFLGPFALTGLLLPHITDRVVTVSSFVHRIGRVDLDDLNWRRRRYRRWGAYAQSKLADLMFAYELDRRLRRAGSPIRSVAAHPGYAATELQSHTESRLDMFMGLSNHLVAQSAAGGARPILYAATAPAVVGGGFYGPDGPGGLRGAPAPTRSSRASRDAPVATRLWSRAEELTGVAAGL